MMHINVRAVFFLLVLLNSAWAGAAKTTVVAFGDSITRGYPYDEHNANGVPNEGGYLPELRSRLVSEEKWDVTILNYGYPGERVTTGVHRFQPGYIYPVLASHPDYVLIMEGTNDLPWGYSPGTIRNRLNFIVDQVKADGGIPILGTLLPRDHHDIGIEEVIPVNDAIHSLATNEKVVLADLYGAVSVGYWLHYAMVSDKLHPNHKGYSIMSKTWSGALVQAKAIQDEIQRQLELERKRRISGAVTAANSLLLLD